MESRSMSKPVDSRQKGVRMELEGRIRMYFSKNSFSPWVPDGSFSADISLDCISGLPKYYSAHLAAPCPDLRSGSGSDAADRSHVKPGYSLLVLIKSVSHVSVLIQAILLRKSEIRNIFSSRRKIPHRLLRLNEIGCFQNQGQRFKVDCLLHLRCHFQED